MKTNYRILKSALILLCFFMVTPAFSTSVTSSTLSKKVLNIKTWQTKKGAKVYFVRMTELPMIDVRVVFAAGSSYDNKDWGVAALTNSMLGEGTVTHNADKIATEFDRVGAQFSASADRDKAMLSLRSLSDVQYLNPALNMFAGIVSRTNFPEKSFQRVKNQTIAEIKMGQQNPSTIASKAFYQAIYGASPYAHSVNGSLTSINKLTRKQAQRFYQQYYVAKNAKIILVGNITQQHAHEIAQKIVANLPEGKSASTLNTVKFVKNPTDKKIKFPSKQTTIILGQAGINRQNPNYFPLIVGNTILGGTSSTSLLFDEIRNKRGLVYSVYSYFLPLKYRGPFRIN